MDLKDSDKMGFGDGAVPFVGPRGLKPAALWDLKPAGLWLLPVFCLMVSGATVSFGAEAEGSGAARAALPAYADVPRIDSAHPELEAAMFWLFAVGAVASAVGVVLSGNIIRMAICLLGTLGSFAALYFLLAANFLGAIQLIVYAGGVLVLIIFGVMLTSKSPWVRFEPSRSELIVGGVVTGLLFVCLTTLLLRVDWPATAQPQAAGGSVAEFGTALLTTYLVPFEIASVMLLVVMIGAAHLARPEK